MFSVASGKPFSAKVGTFGNAATRCGAVAASAITSPGADETREGRNPTDAIGTWRR